MSDPLCSARPSGCALNAPPGGIQDSRPRAGTRQGHQARSGGELSRSALVVLWPFCEPAQFRQSAGELGSSLDRVHLTYLDSGAETRPRGAPARHSLENSRPMPPTPNRADSTRMCGGTMVEQQTQFGTHLLLLRVGNAAEAYVLPAARARTELAGARETTAAEAGHVHQWLPPATAGRPGGRPTWSLASTPMRTNAVRGLGAPVYGRSSSRCRAARPAIAFMART